MIRFDNKAGDTRDASVATRTTPVVGGSVSLEFRTVAAAVAAKHRILLSEYDALARE